MASTHKLPSNGNGPESKISKISNVKAAGDEEFTHGNMIIEGKTKIVYDINSAVDDGRCLIVSKDIITAGDGAKRNVMEGKAVLSNCTNAANMKLLNHFGMKTCYIKSVNDTSFLAWKCHMVPIEWVARRIATGSFLRRHKGVQEGYVFCPPKLETFYKDDENHDPQWSREVLEEAKLECGGVTITADLIDQMENMTITTFEILERVWKTKEVSLIDMKLEFGVRDDTKEIVLADVIDNDSWRIWPSGDKRLMKDKQVYRNLKEMTSDAMKNLKENYQWVCDQLCSIVQSVTEENSSMGKVAIIMGSASDVEHCKKIKSICSKLGITSELHVSSAHKSTSNTLKLLAKIEAQALCTPTVIIAVAGRSNGLGPVLSGNTVLPVINCPPITEKWGSADIWSSLRLPSGLGCVTSMNPDTAALSAAQILAQHNLTIWGRLRSQLLHNVLNIADANASINE